MTRDTIDLKGRRSMIAGLGAAAAGLTLASATSQAQSARRASRDFEPARHEIDAWLGELPGTHRIFVDTATSDGAAEGLVYTNNLYDAQVDAYGGTPADLALIVCFRHFSTPFGYDDALWKKYGAAFAGLMGFAESAQPPTVNPLNAADSGIELPNFGITVGAVMARGARIAICSAATRFVAGQLAQQGGVSADEIFDELVAGAIPSSRFVPAGVVALTRAQEYGYSVLIAG